MDAQTPSQLTAQKADFPILPSVKGHAHLGILMLILKIVTITSQNFVNAFNHQTRLLTLKATQCLIQEMRLSHFRSMTCVKEGSKNKWWGSGGKDSNLLLFQAYLYSHLYMVSVPFPILLSPKSPLLFLFTDILQILVRNQKARGFDYSVLRNGENLGRFQERNERKLPCEETSGPEFVLRELNEAQGTFTDENRAQEHIS